MAERRTERDHILARRPRPMQVKLQRARAPERLAATYSSPCNRDGRARGCPKAPVPACPISAPSAAAPTTTPLASCRIRVALGTADTLRVGLHCLAASPLQSGTSGSQRLDVSGK